MLLFRSEEHVARWQDMYKLQRGETFSLEQQWRLSSRWYRNRLANIVRPTTEQAQEILVEVGLTSPFWSYT